MTIILQPRGLIVEVATGDRTMPVITLPDGSQRIFDKPVTLAEVAADIGPGLAKATIAGSANGKPIDASDLITEDSNVVIFTSKSEEGVEIIRHSSAHLIGHAVKQLFPTAKMAIGPVIEEGFYYDIEYERAFTPEDVDKIEARMKELINSGYDVVKQWATREEAIATFKERGETYKIEIIEQDIPEDQERIGLYHHQEYTDMCRGPHVPNTSFLKNFKLTKVSGSYWRGNAENQVLQRIYGTAWASKKDLNAYVTRMEEASKRDHRKFGKKYDLFHLQEEAPGMVFWHDKGWTIYQAIESYMRSKLKANDYQEVKTPQILDRSLWEKSGHWDKYAENMFTTGSEERTFAIKPMNCPCHVQIYNHGLHSYRELPLRMAEFGSCHRNEPSGTLHGLMRVRNFVQDDAHIFCTEDQIESEVGSFVEFLQEVYADFGFTDIEVFLSTRPEKRVGNDELWDKAETSLEAALNATGLKWSLNAGDGAFYGPKIDFSLRDSIGRSWQLGTMQLDFSMPERLGAVYVAEDNSKKTPVMLHRAILGSLERFIGVVLEHYAGNLPTWLSPVQIAVMSLTDRTKEYATNVADALKKQGFRVETDLRNEKIGFKIRSHTLQRVPYMLVLGDREAEQNMLAVRTRNGEDLGVMSLEDLVAKVEQEIVQKGKTTDS